MFKPQNQLARLQAAGKDIINEVDQAADDLSDVLSAPVSLSSNITLDPLGAVLSGPAASVKGAVDDLGSVLSNPAAAIGGALGGAVGGALGGIFGPSGPQPNSLSKFASYNNIFTFGAISRDSFNTPDTTYRTKGPDILVLQSGGSTNRQVRTQLERAAGITGEYFIDDVEIQSLIAPSSKTKQTNATNISFTVTEPYSMGLFLQTLHVAAAQAGYSNYLEAVYLLQVEFIGWDDNGKSHTSSRSKRLFPLKLSNITFDVAESGSTYQVEAIPYHEIALSDEVQMTKVAVDIKGSTIVELLQTGPESLATILNTQEQESTTKAGNKKIADEYVIMFPTELSSVANAGTGKTENNDGATTQSSAGESTEGSGTDASAEKQQKLFEQLSGIEGGEIPADFDAELSKILGIVVKRSQIGESIREAAEKEENVNAIGKSKIVKSYLDEGKQYFGKPAFVRDEKTGEFSRGNIKISDEGRRINFASGTKVQTIIEEVILLSDYARKWVLEQPDKNGMKTWFRIETDVFLIPGNDNVAQTGEGAKVFVFKVVPYKTHVAKITAPSVAPPGYVNLRKQAARKYDYIYTGENDDIINFNIDINTAFFQALNGDMGQLGKTQKTQGSGGLISTEAASVHGASDGDNTNSSSSGLSGAKQVSKTNTGESGSGVATHPENQIARSFNDTIVNSDTDLIMVDLEIWGDPYYIADSGMGNYSSKNTGGINITADGSMDYQSSEVDIILNFRTPVDTRDPGYMKFPAGGTKAVGAFSGLYQVTQVTNSWSQNKFSQKLTTIRRRNQPEDTGIVPLDIAIESVIEKGLDAIISPLASAPAKAIAGLQGEIQGAVDDLGAILATSPVGGAVANGVAALESGINEAESALSKVLSVPSIAAKQVSDSLGSALSKRTS